MADNLFQRLPDELFESILMLAGVYAVTVCISREWRDASIRILHRQRRLTFSCPFAFFGNDPPNKKRLSAGDMYKCRYLQELRMNGVPGLICMNVIWDRYNLLHKQKHTTSTISGLKLQGMVNDESSEF